MSKDIASVHEGIKPSKCLICKADFKTNRTLNTHIASIHEEQKPFQCEFCDNNLSHKCNLKRHVAAVHEANQMNFSQNDDLKSSIHEGKKPFSCKFCEKDFLRISQCEKCPEDERNKHHSTLCGKDTCDK